MKPVPLIGFLSPSYLDRTLGDAQESVNVYSERAGEGWCLIPFAGIGPSLYSAGNNAACRGAHKADYQGSVKVFSVHGDTVYVNIGVGLVSIGTLETSSGRVYFASNEEYTVLVDGANGYAIDNFSATMSEITDANFPVSPSWITYLNGRFIAGSNSDATLGRNGFRLSQLDDPTNWTPLAEASAENDSDVIMRGMTDYKTLILVGEDTVERWYDVGNADFTFERIPGSTLPIGTQSMHAVAAIKDKVIFPGGASCGLGSFWMVSESGVERISTPQIESLLKPLIGFDTFAFTFSLNGHDFYQVTDVAAGYSWVYDITSKAWSKRSSNGLSYHLASAITQSFAPYLVNNDFVFSLANGAVSEHIHGLVSDDLVKDSESIGEGLVRLFHEEIKFIFEAKHHSSSSYTFSMSLSWSDDDGGSWSTPLVLSQAIPSNGTTVKRIELRSAKLGSSYKRRYRITFDEATPLFFLKYVELKLKQGAF